MKEKESKIEKELSDFDIDFEKPVPRVETSYRSFLEALRESYVEDDTFCMYPHEISDSYKK